jgi:ubiquinone/menaquinone biosynthesis C-methylase UbiE
MLLVRANSNNEIVNNYLKIDEKMTPQEKRQQAQREEFKQINPSWDDSMVIFSKLVGEIIKPQIRLLDVGCGRANVVIDDYRKFINEAVGIDVDTEAVEGNHSLDKIVIGNIDKMPFPDRSFDVIISQWVVEHLQDPERVFTECYRVLKPGGYFLFVTPYAYSSIILIKRIVGPSLTKRILSLVYGREEKDCFETTYRANTPNALLRQLSKAGFKKDVLIRNPDPSYWGFNALVFKIALMFEKIIPQHTTMQLIGRFKK